MIIDLDSFIREGKPRWNELAALLDRMESTGAAALSVDEIRRCHYLYERASSDLAAITTFTFEADTRAYLESLVARAYAIVHETRRSGTRFAPGRWFLQTLPQTFRRQLGAFKWSCLATMVGVLFGALAVSLDPSAKATLMPFGHLLGSPSDRVAEEEAKTEDHIGPVRMQGAAFYMTHNSRVSILTMALGLTWGLGTFVMLFYNGVILGAVIIDYVLAGEAVFLTGWLLPHGSVEIPAVLFAGQAGLMLGSALIGWGRRRTLQERMREIATDLVSLIGFVVLLLIWAGIIEAFLSQYHEPVIPYSIKIAFGGVQLVLLIAYLALAGRKREPPPA